MIILGIDPGTTKSAYVVYDCEWSKLHDFGHLDNGDMVHFLDGIKYHAGRMIVEEIESYGKPVGKEVFATVLWVGRFVQVWQPCVYELLPRRKIKQQLCNSTSAKDAMIRQSLLDRFGPSKAIAVGTKRQPGPLYGVSGDVWQALAVAVAWGELHTQFVPS